MVINQSEIEKQTVIIEFFNCLLFLRNSKILADEKYTIELKDCSIVYVENEKHSNWFVIHENGKSCFWNPTLIGLIGFLEPYTKEEIKESILKTYCKA